MMRPTPSLLYRFLWMIALLCVPYLVILTIDLLTNPFAPEFAFNSPVFRLYLGLVVAPLTLVIGFLISRRRPGNVIGPMLVIWATAVATWAGRSDIQIEVMSVLSNIASVGWLVLITLGLYFPTGRIVPERWHTPLSWAVLAGISAAFLIIPASETLKFNFVEHTNPLYVPAMGTLRDLLTFFVALPLLLAPVVVYSVYRRFKLADTTQRQQLKWLTFGVFPLLLLTPLITFLDASPVNFVKQSPSMFLLGWIYVFPAVCVGNAILHHRLYDIDIIIRRTLIYSVLTGILAALYFGAIILTQQLFRAATGQTSDLAIVVSTLLIAALFTPIRRRVQDTIDRRLYRRKYDVEQTLAAFQRNLREDVDMDTLKANLINVVSDTMQPDRIALWVKDSTAEANVRPLRSP